MSHDPMAGAWIVQGMIVFLALLLVGDACGLPMLGWWGAISLVLAGAAAMIVRTYVRTPNSGE
jgi:hypothetical protein